MHWIGKLITTLFLVSVSQIAFAKTYFCYVPGADGLNEFIRDEVAVELVQQGIPFKAFDIGTRGFVKDRAQRFAKLFEKLLEEDPEAKCHLFAFSMGGLVIRYAVNHLKVEVSPSNGSPSENFLESSPFASIKAEKAEKEISISDRVLTMTSSSSPHKGTPLAVILKQYLDYVMPGATELSEEGLKKFNDLKSKDYSGVIDGIPFYSYRTKIDDKNKAYGHIPFVGFPLLEQELERRERSTANDGIVPLDSQKFGTHLGDIEASHSYFTHTEERRNAGKSLVQFLEEHWQFLTTPPEEAILTKTESEDFPLNRPHDLVGSESQ